MADDAATIEARLVVLRRARASGILEIRHGDTTTRYRSLEELDLIIATLMGDLGRLATTRRTRVRYPIQLTKGL